eukprot:jgi/Chrzof1/14815/Cz09g17110.t1
MPLPPNQASSSSPALDRFVNENDPPLPGHPGPAAPSPPPLPLTLLTWVVPLWRYDEQATIRTAGLDVAMYFRVIRLGGLMCCLALHQNQQVTSPCDKVYGRRDLVIHSLNVACCNQLCI